jgi:hypothetical protein
MEVKELKEKVANAQEKVEKCKATIGKHEVQLAKKLAITAPHGITLENADDIVGDRFFGLPDAVRNAVNDLRWKPEDIKGAQRKLRDAEEILANWQVKLGKEKEKARFIKGNAPQVIIDFLNAWKKLAQEWYIRRYNEYPKFEAKIEKKAYDLTLKTMKENREVYARYFDEKGKLHDYHKDLRNIFPSTLINTALKAEHLDYSSVTRAKRDYAGVVVLKMLEYRNEKERLAWLDKTLEADKKAKMIDLIERVNAITGSIEDAKLLTIDVKGNLNGIVSGPKGKAKVDTIGAGGWNIQCWHYRTLVHALK